jgi:hypothetical protein
MLAPRFEQLWTRAEATKPAPLFRRSFAVTAAVVVVAAAFSFALWSTQSQIALNIAPLQIPTSALPHVTQLAAVVEPPRAQHSRQKRTLRLRQTESIAITDAALLSRWQSPTESLMQSPSVVGFNSLPQLNQSARDFESFLPKKESNQ